MNVFVNNFLLSIYWIIITTTAEELTDDFTLRTNDERKLVEYLLKNYDNSIRPVRNASTPVVIRLGITLTQIFDLDEKNQVLTTNVWLDQEWIDEFLMWNTSLFGSLSKVRIPCEKIWRPDIVLYNNADDYTRGYMNSRAIIEPNGNVFWPPPTKFRSTCQVDVTYFPFDDQRCSLKLGSWIYDGLQVDVLNRTAEVDMSNYVPNGEWDLLGAEIVRNVVHYPCCREPFPDVTITLTIRRKILYYTYNVILPCMMLSVLTLLVFCIPPDSGEKIALGVTVLLAFSVFMLAISEKLPETSESIPLLGIYLTVVMSITSVSVIMTVIVLNFHYRGPVNKQIPDWLRCVSSLTKCETQKSDSDSGKRKTDSNSYNNHQMNTNADNIQRRHQTNMKNKSMPEHSQINVELATNCAHRYALSTESLINIDDNFKLLMNLNRTKSSSNRTSGTLQSPLQPNIGCPSNGNSTVEADSVLRAQEELLDTICKYLLWKNELKVSDSLALHEWRLLALFIDRILFWIFFIIIVSSSLMFLVIIPIQQRGFPYFNIK